MPFLHDLKEIEILEENNNAYKFALKNRGTSVSAFLSQIKGKAKIKKFEVVEPTLHDIFIKLIQQDNE